MSKAKVTVVSYEEFTDIGYKAPSAFYVRSALGDYHYFHTRDRATAQQWCDSLFSVGQYKVNASKMSKSKGELSVTGTSTRRK